MDIKDILADIEEEAGTQEKLASESTGEKEFEENEEYLNKVAAFKKTEKTIISDIEKSTGLNLTEKIEKIAQESAPEEKDISEALNEPYIKVAQEMGILDAQAIEEEANRYGDTLITKLSSFLDSIEED